MNIIVKLPIFALITLPLLACAQQSPIPDTTIPQIYNYQQCVKFGGVILKSYPAKCRTADGKFFTQEIGDITSICENKCGDDLCQEIVCQAEGCPCAESQQNCPNDCQSN